MSRFVIRTEEDYATVYVDVLSNNEIAVEVQRVNKPMNEWTSSRLVKSYKKAYKGHNTRMMGKCRNILQHKYGEDIYVRDGKVYVLTYNGCEIKA